MADKVTNEFRVAVDGAFTGIVTVPRPAWARRVAAGKDGIVLGLDRYVVFKRDGEYVTVSLEDKGGAKVPLVRMAPRGYKMLADVEPKCTSKGLSFEVEGENGLKLAFKDLKMRGGHVYGEFKLKPMDAPHFYATVDLRLTGWAPPEKLKSWRCS